MYFGMKALLGSALLALSVAAGSADASTVHTGDFVVGPTSPGKWGSPTLGTGATVTYSYMSGGQSCAGSSEPTGCTITGLGDFMPTGWEAAIDAAFDAWSAVANISFTKVVDSGHDFNAAGASGDIRIGGHLFDGAGGTLAHGYYPPENRFSAAGDIHFDIEETWKIGFGGTGFDIFQVAAHEIGHAIGLDHTLVPNSLMNPYYTEAFRGLQADDIAGAQYLYGPAVVPVPAALPLLAGSFGLLGLIGWRRRHLPA